MGSGGDGAKPHTRAASAGQRLTAPRLGVGAALSGWEPQVEPQVADFLDTAHHRLALGLDPLS